jgi:hypothetical protein
MGMHHLKRSKGMHHMRRGMEKHHMRGRYGHALHDMQSKADNVFNADDTNTPQYMSSYVFLT